jgi:hypothetical protein
MFHDRSETVPRSLALRLVLGHAREVLLLKRDLGRAMPGMDEVLLGCAEELDINLDTRYPISVRDLDLALLVMRAAGIESSPGSSQPVQDWCLELKADLIAIARGHWDPGDEELSGLMSKLEALHTEVAIIRSIAPAC